MTAVRKDDIVEDYHGTLVADPYRWLEDPDAPETLEWVMEQNRATREHLDSVPARERIERRLTELWNFARYDVPVRRGGRYFYMKNDGLQNQSVVYWQDSLDGEPRLLLDPNTLSDDGTVALTNAQPSEDGALLAYALSSSGSDWQEIRVREVESGQDLPDHVRWCKFTSIAWLKDGSGFFYTRFPTPGTVPEEDQNNYSRVYFHAVGAPQDDDRLVFEYPDDKELLLYAIKVSADGRYVVITASHGTDPRTRLYYCAVAEGHDAPVIPLIEEEDALYEFIDSEGDTFHILTTLDAPKGRIVQVDLARPEREHWRCHVRAADETFEQVKLIDGRYVIVATRDAAHRLLLAPVDGSPRSEVDLPDIGSIAGLEVDRDNGEVFLGFTSFLYPPTALRYRLSDGSPTPWRAPEVDFDVSAYQTTQVFYASKDGTRVPMFLVHRRDLPLDGNNPTLLYGYGGFNINLTPAFSIHRLAWLEAGGVFALANLRGGNEYGEEWHQAGMLERKQNVFDDFIAAAEWLIANGYTRTEKLAINGGSNGGLLVAACMTQRPDLYGAVVCEVPVIDMLRYHRFTVGHFWAPEYGNAEENPEHFRFLYAYSPLHNARPDVEYPPTLITSADTDDRVVPAHAKKFAATLQEHYQGDNPILIRIETKAGHGFGKPTRKVIEERSDVYAFLWRALGVGT